jgi:hypothetical protein
MLPRTGSRPATFPDMLDSAATTNLVAAMLAVNFYPVDRAYRLMPAFRERGLLDPAKVAAMEQEALITAMSAAGYDRGGFLPILSYRLYTLMEALSAGKLDKLPALAASNDEAGFTTSLTAVHGFGPSTAATAWALFRPASPT